VTGLGAFIPTRRLRRRPPRIPGGASPYLSPLMAKGARNSVKNKLGRKVRELRLSLNMSQTALAAKAETHQEFISDLERGEANPTLETIVRIATALGVHVVELFDSRQWRLAERKRARSFRHTS
jgi:DNA-binding XRE family transcriptional regulator